MKEDEGATGADGNVVEEGEELDDDQKEALKKAIAAMLAGGGRPTTKGDRTHDVHAPERQERGS